MLSATTQNIWQTLIATATEQELVWIDGYLAGLLSGKETPAVLPGQPAVSAAGRITIAYGTETGNARALSAKLAATAKMRGFQVKLVSLEQYRQKDIEKETVLFVVVSTQGDGEPPAAARKFYDFLHAGTTTLPQLTFAVLGLGDSAYPLFCQAGADVYALLEKTGAKAFAPLLKCDTDYEEMADAWFGQALQALAGKTVLQPAALPAIKNTRQKHKGTVLASINLNDTGSEKETYHIELQAELSYEPGDAIGVYPLNNERLTRNILELSGVDGSQTVVYRDEVYTVYNLLRERLNVTFLPGRIVEKYASIVGQEIPAASIGLSDLLKIYGLRSPDEFLEILQVLEPNTPRLYSIASAPAAHEGEIHITVGRNRFMIGEEMHYGLCSDYLSRFAPGSEIEFYIHTNKAFRLPEDDKDIIMVGPGTGIAPFRSFLAQREASGAPGRNWLFFGAQHFVCDFLYQTEIQNWQETGLLSRTDVAFSRDQEEKIYVQHRLADQGAGIYEWLESGAVMYICGSKDPMSKDVELALLQIISTQGRKTTDEAEAYLECLRSEGRYHTDVY